MFGQPGGPAPQARGGRADASRTMQIQELKGALARDAYVVDPQAVAEAMLRRGRRSIAWALAAPIVTDGRTPGSTARPSDPEAGRGRHRR
jgi:hypothetical protein